MSIVTLSVNFKGRVQGVGFRFLCARKANSLGVKGWVRNSQKFDLVESVFQGEEKKVYELINYFKENPYFVRVDNVVVDEIKISEKFSNFEVKY